MIIKQYTYNDHLLWWAIDSKAKDVVHDYIITKPTEYATSVQLGTAVEGLNALSLADDLDREIRNKRLASSMFMTSAYNDYAYSATSGEPIYDLGEMVKIKLKIYPTHKNLVPGDYWYGEEKDHVHFTPTSLATYFLRCDREGVFLDPKDFVENTPESRLLQSVFCPKTEEEIMKANVWSYLAFDGLWDCEDLDEEFRNKSGIDMLVQTRSEACYI